MCDVSMAESSLLFDIFCSQKKRNLINLISHSNFFRTSCKCTRCSANVIICFGKPNQSNVHCTMYDIIFSCFVLFVLLALLFYLLTNPKVSQST